MSCPDPTPEPGSIQDLEWQAEQAKKRLLAAQDKKYIEEGGLLEDINDLLGLYNKKTLDTLEEKVKYAVKQARTTNEKYYEELWRKK